MNGLVTLQLRSIESGHAGSMGQVDQVSNSWAVWGAEVNWNPIIELEGVSPEGEVGFGSDPACLMYYGRI